jgi:hypothetical protein
LGEFNLALELQEIGLEKIKIKIIFFKRKKSEYKNTGTYTFLVYM